MSLSTALVPLVIAGGSLGAGWLVTTRVTDRWDRIKKRREMDLAAAQQFQQIYGDFFAIWKSWDSAQRYRETANPPAEAHWECLQRATAAEGALEALLAKIASERTLSAADIDVLGGVRQGFQSLRKAVRSGQNLDWRGSNWASYSAFKGLCAYTSQLLGASYAKQPPLDGKTAAINFHRITDSRHELIWRDTAKLLGLREVKDENPPL